MKIKTFRDRAGWVKISYRKRYFLFGNKVYVVKSNIVGKYTDMTCLSRREAENIYIVLRDIIIKESKADTERRKNE